MHPTWRAGRITLFSLAVTCLLLTTCVTPQEQWQLPTPAPDTTPTIPAASTIRPLRTPTARVSTLVATSVAVRLAGELRLAVRENINTLNPYLVENAAEELAVSLLYDTLLDADDGEHLAPNLAERWAMSSDGIDLTFWLNPQATWHDGEPVSTRDVAFSYDLVRQKQIPGWAHLVALVDRAEAVSDIEVRFTLLRPHADALRLLGTQLMIVPQAVWQGIDDVLHHANLDNPIGSGPFLFVKWVEGEQLVLRNARSHHDVAPSVDTIVVEILRNEDMALQALQEGELDALGWDVMPAIASEVHEGPDAYAGIQVAQAPGLRTETLLLNLRKAPYDNPALRLALAQATDTFAIVEDVLLGFGDLATAALLPPSSPWRNTAIAPIAFDPLQAVTELDAAGFRDRDGDGLRENADGGPMRVPITCPDLPTPLRVAELVAASWRAVGIAAEVHPIAQDLVMPTLLRADFDVILHSMWLAEPDMIRLLLHSSGGAVNNGVVSGLNYGGYASPQYDELVTASTRELDPTKRLELLLSAQEILAADLPMIPLYHPRVLSLYREDHFTGWRTQPGLGLLSRATVAQLSAREG